LAPDQDPSVVPIEGEIIIERPVEEVFDFVADERGEPRYNPRMVRTEKLSAGPHFLPRRVVALLGVGPAAQRQRSARVRRPTLTLKVERSNP